MLNGMRVFETLDGALITPVDRRPCMSLVDP